MKPNNESPGKAGNTEALYKFASIFPVSPKNKEEAAEISHSFLNRGIPSTVCKFNKAGDDSEKLALELGELSDNLALHYCPRPFYISLKPPALNYNAKLTAELAEKAFHNAHGISFDSAEHDSQDPSIKLLNQLMKMTGTAAGCHRVWRYGLTLPSRWKRSLDDAQWVIDHGVRPRIVKGEFKAPGSLETNERKNFLRLVDKLAGKVPELAIATHDYRLAKKAIKRAHKSGSKVQLELLFGMPATGMVHLAKEMDVSVRVYVPYGETLFLHGCRHMLRNPHKFLRSSVLEHFGTYRIKAARLIDLMAEP